MPGPAPDPNARRRNARPDWIKLPMSGRRGRPPAWPIGRPTKTETALWKELWATPQAVAWEQLGWTRIVGRYARLVIAGEGEEASAALLGEVRQMEDRLGLSPMSMKRLQWEVFDDGAAGSGGSGPRGGGSKRRSLATVTDIADFREQYG